MTGERFHGRTALVTGAGSGIGRAAAQLLARDGAAVVVADIAEEAAQATVALIEIAGGRALAIRADVSVSDDNGRMFDAAEKTFDAVDLAFLNAGTLQPYGPFDQITDETFDRVIAVNLRGAFLGLRQASSRLRTGGACVVTSSSAGLIGFAEAAAYSASKHGIVGLVRSTAALFAARGLRVNAICPGMVMTPMNAFAGDDTIASSDTLENPDYRGGLSAQQVAEVALFLLSQGAAGINGQAQSVDAGLLAAFPPLE